MKRRRWVWRMVGVYAVVVVVLTMLLIAKGNPVPIAALGPFEPQVFVLNPEERVYVYVLRERSDDVIRVLEKELGGSGYLREQPRASTWSWSSPLVNVKIWKGELEFKLDPYNRELNSTAYFQVPDVYTVQVRVYKQLTPLRRMLMEAGF